MMRAGYVFLSLFTVLATGCPKNDSAKTDGTAGPTPDGPVSVADGGPLHECVPYTASSITKSINGTWSGTDAKNPHTISIPAEPGGGYLEVRLVGPPVAPLLRAEIGDEITNDSPGTPGSIAKVAFEVASSKSYTLTAEQFVKATPSTYPVTYVFDWRFVGQMDCYEPNDSAKQAKAIPTGQSLEAYLIGGHRQGTQPTNEEYGDWYRFVLDRGSATKVKLTQVPLSVRLRLTLYDAQQQELKNILAQQPGELLTLDAGTLAAGTYLLLIRPAGFGSGASSKLHGDINTLPAHFETPYKFQVTAL